MFWELYAIPMGPDILAALKLSQDAIRQLLFYLEQNLRILQYFYSAFFTVEMLHKLELFAGNPLGGGSLGGLC